MKIKNLIIIHIDALRREYTYCYVLKKAFEKLGFKVLLSSRRNLKTLLHLFSPEILIVTHTYSLTPEFLKEIYQDTDIYVLGVEAVGNESYIYPIDYPENLDYKWFKGVFLWNNNYQKWLINNRKIEPEKVHAFGAPRMGLVEFVEKKKTGIIGFVGRFEFINVFDNRSVFEHLFGFGKEHKHLFYRMFAEIEGFIIYKDLIKYLVEKGYKISIRPHPNECVATYDIFNKAYKDKITIDKSMDLLEWLEGVDVVVATLSTALTDAYLLEKPVISIDGMFKENYMIQYDKYIEPYATITHKPNSISEIKQLFEKKPHKAHKSKEMDEFLKRHYKIAGENGFSCLKDVIRVIHATKKTKFVMDGFKSYFAIFLYYIFDSALVLRSIWKGTYHLNFHYNYCFLFHRPTAFMKRVASKFIKTLQI